MNLKKIRSWVIENIILQFGDWVLGTSLIASLKEQRKLSYLNSQQLEELQKSKLNHILQHATSTCDAYKRISPILSNPLEWLATFPILTKKEITSNGLKYISSKYDINKLIRYESSGSTGQRSVIYIDKVEESLIRAILINWWEWNGYYFGKSILQTGMSPQRGIIKRIKDFLLSTQYMVAFDLSEESIVKNLNKVSKSKSINLFGYSSSLFVLAKTANKYGLSNKFDLAMSQGDKLFDHYKAEISSAFQCNVVEDYGLNEGFMVGQKVDLPYFYIYTPSVFIEILDQQGKLVPDGEIGRIILTKLDGFAMPLIRYDTGDLGIKLPIEKYPINRRFSFPLLERVIGRNTDIIITPEGNSLIVHTFTGIFEFFPEIDQFQIVQDTPEQIIIKYIPSEIFQNKVLKSIENELKIKSNSGIKIIWQEVKSIIPSSSGKPQIIINNLIKNSLSTFQ